MTNIIIKKSLPALPAVNIKETIAFYKQLGFVNLYEGKKRSGGYAIMNNDLLEFHIYAYKKLPIPTPTNIYIYEVEQVDALHQLFEETYLKNVGKKLPRTGLPRMGVPKNLNSDRRFSITDPNGNHFIFTEVFAEQQDHQIQSGFEKLYWESNTLAYSHESPLEAKKMLESAFKRNDITQEQPYIVFQAYVLLVDCAVLLDLPNEASEYYKEATKWLAHTEDPNNEYFSDAMKQYQKYAYLGANHD